MASSLLTWIVTILLGGGFLLGLIVLYVMIKFSPIVTRNFQRPPLFQPLMLDHEPGGEEVRFQTGDGVELAGTYFRARRSPRQGVVVFCHEFLSDRWSFQPYAIPLLEAGYDVFTFDFRNHGDSAVVADYQPLQWVSDREASDLKAAVTYVMSRPDADPAGVLLFGISRGGSAALCVAADDSRVRAVITDGAFPTRGTLRVYMSRWAEVYLPWRCVAHNLPWWLIDLVAWTSHHLSQNHLKRRFLNVERAVARLAPRPWLMIHGERDAYITPEIARSLFAAATGPKDAYFVPNARHNRCLEAEPETYIRRVLQFLARGNGSAHALSLTAEPLRASSLRTKVAVPMA